MSEILHNLKLLEEKQTEYQNVKFYESEEGKLMLVLDTFIQFVEGEDEEIYHNVLVTPTIKDNPNAKDFLILGGGDGLVARNILDLKSNAKITLIELDKIVIAFFKKNKRLTELNKNSLNKCNIIIKDAKKWVKKSKDKFDVIILDLPDPNSDELKKLYEKEFLIDTFKLLRNKGVISIQCHEDISKQVVKIMSKLVKKIRSIEYSMPFLSEGVIVVGNV